MNLKELLRIMKALGARLPDAWPHLMNIVAEVKAILALLAIPDLTTAARFGAASPAEANELEQLAAQYGLDAKQAHEAATAFHAMENL